jgi:hypothetical protein
MRRNKARLAPVLLAVALVAACGSSRLASETSGTSKNPLALPASSSATSTPVEGLAGRWERVTTCQELVGNLRKAGLALLAPYAWLGQTSSTGESSFAPGSPEPTLGHPCTGALARTHAHFFDESGQFGSLDWLGGQVDDGSYQIIDGNTFSIGSVAFHYRIVNGDTLTLSPVLTKAMVRQARGVRRGNPVEVSAAGWAVSVAYAGYTWKRVPCEGWC